MNKNKKIFFIITDYGSFNNFLSELSIELIKNDYEVHVITSKEKVIKIEDKYDYEKFGINFYYFNFPRNFNLITHYKISRQIQNQIKIISPDLVSIHFTTGIFTTLLAGKLPFRTIGTFHGLGFPIITDTIKKLTFKFVELFSASRLQEVWVLNRMDFNILEKYFPKKTFLLPTNGLGCDLETFNIENFSALNKSELKNTLKIDANDFVITFTGRYVDFKGYHIVIKTFRILEEFYKLKNIKLITMGGRDKIHSTGLEDEEEQYLKNNNNIIDIGFTNEVAKFLSITDLFFFPSKKEGVPICIVEALSMGIPVITYNSRGCNDLVIDSFNGNLLNEEMTPEDFAKQIFNLYSNPHTLQAYSSNALGERIKMSRENFINFQLNEIINSKTN